MNLVIIIAGILHLRRKYGTHGTKRTVGTHGRTHGWSKNAR
jgi:hypothetical protein